MAENDHYFIPSTGFKVVDKLVGPSYNLLGGVGTNGDSLSGPPDVNFSNAQLDRSRVVNVGGHSLLKREQCLSILKMMGPRLNSGKVLHRSFLRRNIKAKRGKNKKRGSVGSVKVTIGAEEPGVTLAKPLLALSPNNVFFSESF